MFIYNELKSHKKHDKDVELTFDEFLEIIDNPICHYCNTPLKYEKYSRDWGKTNSRAHQLDRKNNDLGYSKDNLVTCCWDCNRLKSNRFTYDEFMQLSPVLKKIMNERKERSKEN
jgi:5-methylcytosine-specific restriction endonuclease McrA